MNILDCELYIKDIKKALHQYNYQEFNNKRILVTGATGLICSALVDALLCLNECGIDIQITCAGRNPERIKRRFNNRVAAKKYDALEPFSLVDEKEFDYIVCGAGNASPELYINNPVETMLTNITGINNILKHSLGRDVKIAYISSSEVYGKKNGKEQFSEQSYGVIDIDNIRNSYSESKRASELLCKAYSAEYGVHVVIVRPGHVYGPTASIADKRVSSSFAYKSSLGEDLVLLSSGMQRRSYVYCVDSAMAILVSLLYGQSGESYNIGTHDVISIKEMAKIMADSGRVKLMAKEPTAEELSAFNPMNNSSLTLEKLESIGYKECFSPKEGLGHTVSILKELVHE